MYVFKKVIKKIQFITQVNLVAYIKYNFLMSNVRKITGRIIPYKHTILQITKKSKINLKGNLYINAHKLKRSKAECLIKMGEHSELNVNGNFKFFYQCNIAIFDHGNLTIGSGYANYGTQIRCLDSIYIGNKVAIGNNVVIMDSDFHTIEFKNGLKNEKSLPVIIGDNVWIGRDSTILKGVRVGNGAIIGARSVVTRDVPEHSIVAGNPAKVIKEDVRWY